MANNSNRIETSIYVLCALCTMYTSEYILEMLTAYSFSVLNILYIAFVSLCVCVLACNASIDEYPRSFVKM